MYKYGKGFSAGKRRQESLKFISAKVRNVVVASLGLVFLITPVASFAKGGSVPSTIADNTVVAPASYNLNFKTVNYSIDNALNTTGSISINNFVDREDGQNIKISWGDGSFEISKIMSLPGYYKSGNSISVPGISKTHKYNSVGPWKVTISLYVTDKNGNTTYIPATGQYTFTTENTIANCSDSSDNDKDGMRNLSDSDCAQFRVPETTATLCADGIDNDNSGALDLNDLNCAEFLPPENTVLSCSDGIDNDRDGKIDLYDSNCAEFLPPENTPELCTDGVDNDLDGKVDGKDTNCEGLTPPENTADVCLDAIDNDFDGLFDWDDTDCAEFIVPVSCPTGYLQLFIPGHGFICGAFAGY